LAALILAALVILKLIWMKIFPKETEEEIKAKQ